MQPNPYEQITKKNVPGAVLLRHWRMEGGVSAQVTGLELLLADGQQAKMVIRQHGAADQARNPRIAKDEFLLLDRLYKAGLSVPAPYAIDESLELLNAPYLLLEYVESEADWRPSDIASCSRQLAGQLASIHQLPVRAGEFISLPSQEELYTQLLAKVPPIPDTSLSEERILSVLESVWPLPQWNQTALLHGDYWPGNVLWREDELVCVIDWEDAALGDPLADFANTRLEVFWAWGREALESFTGEYMRLMPDLRYNQQPYWDLCAALKPASKLSGWGLEPAKEQDMRSKHQAFVNEAFAAIRAMED